MKLIIAVVRPFKVTEMVDAIAAMADFPGMTVLGVRGFGREKTAPSRHHVAEHPHDFMEREAILIAASDDSAPGIVKLVTEIAHTGRPGDGKVFVVPLDQAIRIATGETGDHALR